MWVDNVIIACHGKTGQHNKPSWTKPTEPTHSCHALGLDGDEIIITRPTVTAEEDLGFLPGSFEDKLAPYTAGTFGHIVDLTDTVKLEAMIKEGRIEVEPLGFMRGRNFSDCVVILEEAQNCKRKQMKLLLTRLCKGSKLIMTGDEDQVDLKPESLSCYGVLARLLPTLDDVAVVELLENHRDELVDRILELYKGHPELQ